MSLRNKSVLVTGGAGFLGSHLCDKILTLPIKKLVIVDDFSLGREKNIENVRKHKNIEVYVADASNYSLMDGIIEKDDIDIIFNLAVVPLPTSLQFPKLAIDTNMNIVTSLCELLRKGKYEVLIHISSSEAYGTSVYIDKPMDENHPTFPITPYAASKLAGDHIALSYHKTFGSKISIIRPFNMYGPRQNEKTYAGVIPKTIKRIMQGDGPVIHGDGLQTRDFSYVEDIANEIPKFYEATSTRGRVVNLASGEEISIKELIKQIAELMDYSGKIVYTKPRRGDVRRHLGDISLAKKLIGYSPNTDFRKGLIKTIDWYVSENV